MDGLAFGGGGGVSWNGDAGFEDDGEGDGVEVRANCGVVVSGKVLGGVEGAIEEVFVHVWIGLDSGSPDLGPWKEVILGWWLTLAEGDADSRTQLAAVVVVLISDRKHIPRKEPA